MVQKIYEIIESIGKRLKLITDIIIFSILILVCTWLYLEWDRFKKSEKNNVSTIYKGTTERGDTILYVPEFDFYFVKQK
jgi:hypothetical protein